MAEEKVPYMKPVPGIEGPNKEILEGWKRHELTCQRCKNCGLRRFPSQTTCPNCLSLEWEWSKIGNKGKVFSYVIVHQSSLPMFAGPPYGVAIVSIDDTPEVRWMADIVIDDPWKIHVGMPVEAVFDDVTPEATILRWKEAG